MLKLLLLIVAGPVTTPPQPWALSFAAPPRMPFVGDVDGDGLADLALVYPPGGSIIDVDLSVDGQKTGGGIQALSSWGKDCQAALCGQFDTVAGADVLGIFGGRELRVAGSYKDRRFVDEGVWCTLPSSLDAPAIALIDGGATVLAFSTKSGAAFLVDQNTKAVSVANVPVGAVWIGDTGAQLAMQDGAGALSWLSRNGFAKGDAIGSERTGSRPAATNGMLAFGDTLWTPHGTTKLASDGLPEADAVRAFGDVDGDGDQDLVDFRFGSEMHTAYQVFLRRTVSPGEIDPDHDGLTNLMEKVLGTDPLNPDTDNDGLLDGWEIDGFRGLDLRALGCDPRHMDTVCLVSRFSGVAQETLQKGMDRVIQFYKGLKFANPDGTDGLTFHPVYVDEVAEADQKNSWQTNRAKFLPPQWRGVVHWMQVTPGGGGQADELGDGGSVGQNALWAVFVHEFGHQMGLNHEGFWPNSLCPTYTSLMNYAYSYSLEDDGNKIHYSDGKLAGYVLRETDLDETIPFPYDEVKFLERGPYRFRLKPNGDTTLIDWNWNGVFGEKHIRADINYSYSTNAGARDDAGRTMTSPWLFVHDGKAFVLFGRHDLPKDPKIDPTTGPDRPSRLMLRRLQEPRKWDEPWTIEKDGLVGDPVGASIGGKVALFYQTTAGVAMRMFAVSEAGPADSQPVIVDKDSTLVPTVGTYMNQAYLFLTNPADGKVQYRPVAADGTLGTVRTLAETSDDPVGMCEDKVAGEAVIAMAHKQGDKRNRWKVHRFILKDGAFDEVSSEWVSGEGGGSAGSGRLTVLFDSSQNAGPAGRIYLYGRGLTSAQTPWSCTYVAMQIADKSVNGGWLVKRFYDEWTQSRSAPAAAWFGGDVIWAYRWVDGGQGASDNVLHVGYRALGIEDTPMGDHDDIGFITKFGIRNSLISLGRG